LFKIAVFWTENIMCCFRAMLFITSYQTS